MVAYAWISLDRSGHQHLQYQKVSFSLLLENLSFPYKPKEWIYPLFKSDRIVSQDKKHAHDGIRTSRIPCLAIAFNFKKFGLFVFIQVQSFPSFTSILKVCIKTHL